MPWRHRPGTFEAALQVRLVGVAMRVGDLGNVTAAPQGLARTLETAIQQIRMRGQPVRLTEAAIKRGAGIPASVHSSRSETARA